MFAVMKPDGRVQIRNLFEMKGRVLIVLLSLLSLCQPKHHRFLSVKCGASKKTAVDLFCFLKSYTRKNPVVSGSFSLLRTVPDGLVLHLTLNLLEIFTLICTGFDESRPFVEV